MPDKIKTNDCALSCAAFICGALRLKVQQDSLDKTQTSLLNSLKLLDPQAGEEWESLKRNLDEKRLSDDKLLQESILEIVNSLIDLKLDISTEERIKNLDTRQYHARLLNVESKLEDMKGWNDKQLENLAREERELWCCLQDVDNKLDDWVKPVDAQPSRITLTTSTSHDNGLQNEVRMFHKFIAKTGGYTGGWNEEDHMTFLRLRNKHKGKPTFFVELKDLLPDLSHEEMAAHEEWYCQYQHLRSEQKRAIDRWRLMKSNKSCEETSEAPNTVCHISTENTAEKKHRIEDWKKAKELKRLLEEQKIQEERAKKLKEWNKKKEIQAQRKASLDRIRDQRLSEQREAKISKQLQELFEVEQRALQANKLLKTFRQQDQEFLARRLRWKEKKEQLEEEREHIKAQIRQQVTVNAERDPKRLIQPTKGWSARLAHKKCEDRTQHSAPPLYIGNMPHLAVPSWRKGLC